MYLLTELNLFMGKVVVIQFYLTTRQKYTQISFYWGK